MKHNTETILAGLKLADEKIYKELYNTNYMSVEQFILKNSGTIHDAKDIFQDTMLVLVKKVQADNFVLTSSIDTYLFAISRNLWLKRLRNISTHPNISMNKQDFSDLQEDNTTALENEKTYLEKIKNLMGKLSAIATICYIP